MSESQTHDISGIEMSESHSDADVVLEEIPSRAFVRSEITRSREGAADALDVERNRVGEGKKAWGVYDSGLDSYDSMFRSVLGEGYETIEEFIRHTYPDCLGDLVGLELGGPGSRLFADLKNDALFRKTAGVTLLDVRPSQLKETDTLNGHDVIQADVFTSGFTDNNDESVPGWGAVRKWVAENGRPDIIIERMVAGIVPLGKSPESVDFLKLNILRWYKILNQRGTMLLELPEGAGHIAELAAKLDPLLFDVDIKQGSLKGRAIKIRRLENSPDRLEDLVG